MVTDSNELLGQSLGTCTLKELLGRGGMGAVYLAQQSRPRRTVAVKVLLPGIIEQRPRAEFLTRFRREADAIAALDHINIMPVYEYGEQGETAYLVMPYVTGGTLREVLAKRGSLNLEEVVPIIEQAAAGLDSAHEQSIVHRDLKPGNILFHADGRVLIADFGLAKVIKDVTDAESTNGHLTSIGTIVGTPEYLSPEQGAGDNVDYRTDVYSLGIVLYQMLAGRVPFTGTSPVAIAIKHTIEAAPPVTRFNPAIPPGVEAVVMKAIEKSPDQRFGSAGELALALRQAVTAALGGVLPLPGEEYAQRYGTFKHKASRPLTSNPGATGPVTPEPHTNEPQSPVAPLSTVMMPKEPQHAYASPRLDPLQERLQAQHTVVTDDEKTTIATPQKLVLKAQPQTPPQPVTRPVAQHQPVMEARVLADQHAIHYPQQGQRRKPFWLLIGGTLLVMALVFGGLSAIYFKPGNGQPGKQTNVGATQPTATNTTGPTPGNNQTGTPSATGTTPALSPIAGPSESVLQMGVGQKAYATNTPGGSCDPFGGKWNTSSNAAIQCGGKNITMSSKDGNPASTLLTSARGTNLPTGNYVIQVEANMNSAGLFGIMFRNKPGTIHQGAYAYLVNPAGIWSAYNYDEKTGNGTPFADNQSLQNKVQGNITLTVVVKGNQFYLYINNTKEGTAYYSSGGYEEGEIGLITYPGANVTFKNLVLYHGS